MFEFCFVKIVSLFITSPSLKAPSSETPDQIPLQFDSFLRSFPNYSFVCSVLSGCWVSAFDLPSAENRMYSDFCHFLCSSSFSSIGIGNNSSLKILSSSNMNFLFFYICCGYSYLYSIVRHFCEMKFSNVLWELTILHTWVLC